MGLVRGRVNRANIQDLFLRGIGDSLIGERDNSQNHENNSSKRGCLHMWAFFPDIGPVHDVRLGSGQPSFTDFSFTIEMSVSVSR
jgi:hypothetical protein